MELIKTNKFSIRKWEWGDEESIVKHANNFKVSRNLRDHFPYPYTIDDAKKWLNTVTERKLHTNFAISIDSLAVGGIGVILGTAEHVNSAEIGYWLGEEFWSQGIMTEVVKLFCEYVFKTYDNLCRIHTIIFESNPASMRVLEKNGFQLEGIMRKHVTKHGKTMDAHIYALLKS
jgi:ribosomal-protein-alanine N-acetyltransferase